MYIVLLAACSVQGGIETGKIEDAGVMYDKVDDMIRLMSEDREVPDKDYVLPDVYREDN